MKYEEFDSLFQQSAMSLSYNEGLSLAITICHRLFSDYEYFVSVEGWGNKVLLLDAIHLYEQAGTRIVAPTKIEEMVKKVDTILPDTENFGEYHGSYALNAGSSVYETLQFILDRNLLHI